MWDKCQIEIANKKMYASQNNLFSPSSRRENGGENILTTANRHGKYAKGKSAKKQRSVAACQQRT